MRALYGNKMKCKRWNKKNNGRSSASPHGVPSYRWTLSYSIAHSSASEEEEVHFSPSVSPWSCILIQKTTCTQQHQKLAKFYYSSMLHAILQTPCHLGFTVILWNGHHYYLYFTGETEVKLNYIACPGHSGNEVVILAPMSQLSPAM